MKKFLLIALVVAFGATTALAGDFAANGTYWVSGQQINTKYTSGLKNTDAFYLNDFQLNTTFTQGAVTAAINWEITDGNYYGFAGKEVQGFFRPRHNNGENTAAEDIIGNYSITYKAMDNLTFKTGSYGLGWGRGLFISDSLSTSNVGVVGYNIGVTYGLEMVDLGLTISKLEDGSFTKASGDIIDADNDVYLLSAAFKKAGPFTKLNFYLLANMVEKGLTTTGSNKTNTLLAGDFAVPAGPVALAGEFGLFGGDLANGNKSEGNYIELEAGLKELVGFNLNLGLLYSSDKATSGTFGDNWSPLLILGNNHLTYASSGPNFNNGNKTLLWISGSYPVNDKLTLGGAILPVGQATKVATGSKSIGTEIDLNATYKLADNVTYTAAYGMATMGDLGKALWGTKDINTFYNKIAFTF